MNGQFEWSESGKLLLSTINNYIELEGGRTELLKKMIAEERHARNMAYKLSHSKVGRKKFTLKRTFKTKGIELYKNGRRKLFRSAEIASNYLEVNYGAIHKAISKGYNCKGWKVRYSDKYFYRNVYIKMGGE